ncbi:MAG TPA: hypothetical protein VLY03_03180 [Bacteroidota bacterium]|nr:hypothetical protein [Bacteroidota bacterium]
MNRFLGALLIVAAGLAVFHGCDLLTDFPIILNGSVEPGALRVDLNTPLPIQYQTSSSVDLSQVKNAATSDVDSVRFYNLTVRIDSNSTPNSTISGSIIVDGDTLVTMNNMKTSVFSSERSIFSTSITGWQYHVAGVETLIGALRNSRTVTLTTTLNSLTQPIHCTIHIKVYGQLFVANK